MESTGGERVFGTDGVRGLANGLLTAELALDLSVAAAHVLGEASERHYGCHLCIGPPTDEGFFYEMAIEDRSVSLSLLLSFAALLS